MDSILIIEDDKGLNQGLCRALQSERIQTYSCFSVKQARQYLSQNKTSLVILDINLPDGNGFDFLQEIKMTYVSLPVVILTANDTDVDIVNGLELGADDYITKPFSLAVLRARVNTQLRKLQNSKDVNTNKEVITFDKYSFDFDKMEFMSGNTKVELSKTEQKLLRILVENPNITLSRDTLIDRIWTDGAEYVDENALSVSIKRLRDKLDASEYIRTVYGIGYVWETK